MEELTRRQLLVRGTALALGAVPFADALADAATSPSGIFRELDRSLRGDVVQRGAPGYNAARMVLKDWRAGTSTAMMKPSASASTITVTISM